MQGAFLHRLESFRAQEVADDETRRVRFLRRLRRSGWIVENHARPTFKLVLRQ